MNEIEEEFKRLCHQMAYGDDSDETFNKYLIFIGFEGSDEEKKELKESIFDD